MSTKYAEQKEYNTILESFADLSKERENKILKEYTETSDRIMDKKESRDVVRNKYLQFKESVKDLLLSEAILNIYSSCLENAGSTIAKNLVYNYVKENGSENIMSNMKRTYALEVVQNLVNNYTKSILEEVDETDPETFRASLEDKVKFLDDLNNEKDIENVKQAIALRVSAAEEEFMNANIADKADMDEILDNTKSRIDAVNKDVESEETAEAIKQEMTMESRRMIGDIRENREQNILENMVRIISSNVIKDEKLKEEYCKEGGKLNIGKVIGTAKMIYGFLESLNTLQLETITPEYIEKALDELK